MPVESNACRGDGSSRCQAVYYCKTSFYSKNGSCARLAVGSSAAAAALPDAVRSGRVAAAFLRAGVDRRQRFL